MFLLYSKPLVVSLPTWNKSRVVAVVHQTLFKLDPSGPLLLFSITLLLAASISAVPASLLVVDTVSMIPPQGFCIGCSRYLEYLSTHMCRVCSLTSFRSPNKFLPIREIPKIVPSRPCYCLSPYLYLFFS